VFILTTINPSGDSKISLNDTLAVCRYLEEVDWTSTLRVIVERKL
jgi:hypothetical protein